MKIAFLSKDYPPYGLNFASALFYPKLATALVGLGHEVHVISQAAHREEEYVEQGIHIHRVGPPPKTGSGLVRMRYNLSAWFKLRELVTRYSIELVDAPVTFGDAFFPSLWRSVPLVLQTFAFSDMFLKTKSYGSITELISLKLSSFLEDISLRRADRIIANSPQIYRYLIEEKQLPAERVKLVWEARIDFNKFKFTPSDIRAKLDISPDSPLIFYVGWLQARKGVHILCEVIPAIVKHFPKAQFVLLGRDTNSAPGGGSFKEYISHRAKQYGFVSNVRIIDSFILEEELIKLYSACDLFVLPSLSETFGWPVIEAMACERPVVATTTGIVLELAKETPGLMAVPPGDSQALAQGMLYFLSMPKEKREALARKSRQIVKKTFSFDKMVESYVGVYKSLVAK